MALAICLAVNLGALLGAVPFLYALIRQRRLVTLSPLLPWVGFVAVGPSMPGLLVALALSNLTVVVLLVLRSPAFEELLEYFFDFPAFLVVASFGAVILLGSLLLTLPAASPGPAAISPIDALFTSTSATCVTGLIVLDTPHDFTMFGQAVILSLIQVGGLGIMVVSTFGAVILGQGLGLRGEQALGDLMDIQGAGDAYRLTQFIVTTTLVVEAVGTACLTLGYWNRGRAFDEALWHGLFHAISAFCNAGFALQSDSIVMFQENPLMLGVFSGLIIVGGLGFVVLATAWSWLADHHRPQFDMQARVILVMTGVLLVAGALLYGAVEWSATLQGMSTPDKITNAVFQSVTLRTAGFNSVAFDPLHPASLVFMMLFMFIGASPGSTGGGVKTTTIAVLLGAVRSIATGKTRVVFFGRRVPQRIVYRSAAIVAVAGFFLVAGSFVLFLVEDITFRATLFETFSALGTVGLSIGATGELHAAGKLTIIVLMFVGRTGPLTVALLLGKSESSNVNYPESEIMVG
jgi:trk system potassium uptake protein TrkH